MTISFWRKTLKVLCICIFLGKKNRLHTTGTKGVSLRLPPQQQGKLQIKGPFSFFLRMQSNRDSQIRGYGIKKEVDRGWIIFGSLLFQECSGTLSVAKEQFWEDYCDKSPTSLWSGHQNYTNVCRQDSCLAYFHKCTGVVQIGPWHQLYIHFHCVWVLQIRVDGWYVGERLKEREIPVFPACDV